MLLESVPVPRFPPVALAVTEVAVFENETKAYEGEKALLLLDAEGSISVYAHAVIEKQADGTVKVKQHGPGRSALLSALCSEASLQSGRPFRNPALCGTHCMPYLSDVEMMENHDYSFYHGLQVTLRQRSYKGMSFVLGYTWAHAIDLCGRNRSFDLAIKDSRYFLDGRFSRFWIFP